MATWSKGHPCPECGSRDNLKYDGEGGWHCFTPTCTNRNSGIDMRDELNYKTIRGLPIQDMSERGFPLDYAKMYQVRCYHPDNNTKAYCYPLTAGGKVVAYKIRVIRQYGRDPEKKARFFVVWKSESDRQKHRGNLDMFGTLFVRGGKPCSVPDGGTHVIIVGGQDDCIAARMMLDQQGKEGYPVLSVPDGEGSGMPILRQLAKGYKKVYIAMDPDEAGKAAAQKMSKILGHDQAYLVDLKTGDPNDLLRSGSANTFLRIINSSQPKSGQSIKHAAGLWEEYKSHKVKEAIPYPSAYSSLQQATGGRRYGEMTTLIAGTSAGKSSHIIEIIYSDLMEGRNVGVVMLEDSDNDILRKLMAVHFGVLPDEMGLANIDPEEERRAFDKLMKHLFIISDEENPAALDILNSFRFLRHHHGCRVLILDHVTAAVSMSSDNSLVDQTQFVLGLLGLLKGEDPPWMGVVAHLRKGGDNPTWSEGRIPSEYDSIGSSSLAQLTYDMVGFVRDKTNPSNAIKNKTAIHLLKCRAKGRNTGPVGWLMYDVDDGRLHDWPGGPDDGDPYSIEANPRNKED